MFTDLFTTRLGNSYLTKIQGSFNNEKVEFLSEELLSPTFGAHWQALTKNPNFLLQAGDIDKLVAYLLSIDGATPTLPIPPARPKSMKIAAATSCTVTPATTSWKATTAPI